MKLKVFHIRLTKEHFQTDQENVNRFLEKVYVKKTATNLVNGQPNFWSILVFYEEQKPEKASDKLAITDENELNENEKSLLNILKQWRQDKSVELNLPNYLICHHTELITIAKVKPQTLEDLAKIKGFGEQKLMRYGQELLEVLNSI